MTSAGFSYGRWIIIDGPVRGPNSRIVWLCRCECGKEKFVDAHNLKSGKSSGCMSCSQKGKHSGQVNTSEFSRRFSHISTKIRAKLRQAAWSAINRCTNTNYKKYADYGGRGIQVKFADKVDFFKHLLTLSGHDDFSLILDRIDNNGHYEPGNLRFVTRSESQLNRRTSRR